VAPRGQFSMARDSWPSSLQITLSTEPPLSLEPVSMALFRCCAAADSDTNCLSVSFHRDFPFGHGGVSRRHRRTPRSGFDAGGVKSRKAQRVPPPGPDSDALRRPEYPSLLENLIPRLEPNRWQVRCASNSQRASACSETTRRARRRHRHPSRSCATGVTKKWERPCGPALARHCPGGGVYEIR
jgi:hypothetical protein